MPLVTEVQTELTPAPITATVDDANRSRFGALTFCCISLSMSRDEEILGRGIDIYGADFSGRSVELGETHCALSTVAPNGFDIAFPGDGAVRLPPPDVSFPVASLHRHPLKPALLR